MLTFVKKLKIFNKRLIFLVKFLRYFVSKLQFLIKLKMQLNAKFNFIIQQMDEEKKCLLLDQELQSFDLVFFSKDFSIVLEDYKVYKHELLFFFLEYEDFFLRAIDISVIRELHSFVKDLSYLFEHFEALNKIEDDNLLTEDLIKKFFSNFFKFYKSIKIYFWFVEKSEESVLSEILMKAQNEKLNYFLSPWASEDDYDAEKLEGTFPLHLLKDKSSALEEEEYDYSDSDFIIAYGTFSTIDIDAEITKDPLLIALTKKKTH
jgi:hypothetical protein